MSYQNIAKPIMQYLSCFEEPKVLEIGIDKGQTALPICHNLSLLERPFLYEGVDINVRDEVALAVASMAKLYSHTTEPGLGFHNVVLYQRNSLDFLATAIDNRRKYNLILIDGDHNYYTIYNELKLVQHLTLPSTIIVCDDYNTNWAYKDMYYSEREGYEDNELATKRQETEKAGVRPAVDDFIKDSNGKWKVQHGLGQGSDYCILYQRENVLDMRYYSTPLTTQASSGILEIYFDKRKCPEVNEDLLINLDYIYERPGPRSYQKTQGGQNG
jgi:hypothetical protein